MDSLCYAVPEEADREAVLTLYAACSHLPGCTWSSDYPTREVFDHDVANGWLHCLKSGSEIIAVFSLGDFGELHTEDISWNKAISKHCELARIGVKPEFGGKGIGTQVLKYAMETARKQGFDGIRLLVSPTNLRAVAMYRRAGFVTEGEADLFDNHWLCQDLKL